MSRRPEISTTMSVIRVIMAIEIAHGYSNRFVLARQTPCDRTPTSCDTLQKVDARTHGRGDSTEFDSKSCSTTMGPRNIPLNDVYLSTPEQFAMPRGIALSKALVYGWVGFR